MNRRHQNSQGDQITGEPQAAASNEIGDTTAHRETNMERDKRDDQGRLTDKKSSGEKREAAENKSLGKADDDILAQKKGLLREPSGAEAYAQNADLEHTERMGKKLPEPDGVNAASEREVSSYMQRIAETNQEVPPGGGHTEEEYFALPDDLRVELIDGVFYAMASPARIHQTVCIELVRQLADCVEEHDVPCFVYTAPSDVALGADKKTIVQPHIYVHCDREKDVAPGPYRGAPDFVIEVLSPSNPEHDLWRKRELYQRCGVREYWIVDAHGQNVYVFHFEKLSDSKDMGENSEKYSFEGNVPIGISDGMCSVDFRRVYRKIRHFLE